MILKISFLWNKFLLYFLLYYPHYNAAYQKHSETPLCTMLHVRWMADVIYSSHFWPTETSCVNLDISHRSFKWLGLNSSSETRTEDSSMLNLWSAQSNFFVLRDLKFNYRTTICCNYCGCACVYVHTWNIIKLHTGNWTFLSLSLLYQTLGCSPDWLKVQ